MRWGKGLKGTKRRKEVIYSTYRPIYMKDIGKKVAITVEDAGEAVSSGQIQLSIKAKRKESFQRSS